MDKIQKVLVDAGRKDLAQKYYRKISKKTVIDRIKSKHGDLEIEVIEDSAGDISGHLLNFKLKRPLQVTLAKDKWPDPIAEREAINLAKKLINTIDKAIGR